MRNRLPEEQWFFMHIAKTAGTSLISLLDQRFTADEICPLDRATRKQFRLTFSERQRLAFKFVRGHFPYSLKDDLRAPRLITFLREPTERSLSEIHHLKRMERQGLKYIAEPIAHLTVEEFLEHPILGCHVVNRATKYLNDFDSVTTVVSPAEPNPDLALAKERLAQFDFIGITERFAESLELFTYTFGLPSIHKFPVLQASADRESWQNVSPHIIEKLEKMNRAETELYQYGLQMFEQRLDDMKAKRGLKIPEREFPQEATLSIDFRRVCPGQGWHVGESHPLFGTIRWSGPETESRLYLTLAGERSRIVRFRVLQAVSPEVLETLTLEINGKPVDLTRIHEKGEGSAIFEGQIPTSALRRVSGASVLTFRVAKTHRPGEFDPQNLDTRLLGLCYNWIHIYPA